MIAIFRVDGSRIPGPESVVYELSTGSVYVDAPAHMLQLLVELQVIQILHLLVELQGRKLLSVVIVKSCVNKQAGS